MKQAGSKSIKAGCAMFIGTGIGVGQLAVSGRSVNLDVAGKGNVTKKVSSATGASNGCRKGMASPSNDYSESTCYLPDRLSGIGGGPDRTLVVQTLPASILPLTSDEHGTKYTNLVDCGGSRVGRNQFQST